MSKTSKAEYMAELEQAEAGWDDESAEPQSEAERLAHAAQGPKTRVDGLPVASEHKRGKALTLNQQRFVQGVIRGQSLRASYREAFQNDTGSDASISASANKLMKDPDRKSVV